MGIFQGEEMVCALCQFRQQSDPQIESSWFGVVVGGTKKHCCPKCGGAPAPKCQACDRYYHERYGIKCPWCGHSQSKAPSKGFGR